MEAPYAPILRTIADRHPLLGLALLHHRTLRGTALSFADKPALVEPYRDLPTLDAMVARKAVQTGWTELFVIATIEAAGFRGRQVVYVLPTDGIRDTFVHTRIDPALLMVPAYRAKLPGQVENPDDGADSLRLKRLGTGMMRFIGSQKPNQFVEFSADLAIVDEVDHCEADNLALLPDRLRASPYPQLFQVGNPTTATGAISVAFGASDGRRWHFRCDRCGERQPVGWFTHLVERDATGAWVPMDRDRAADGGDLRPVCRRCRQPFERVATGAQWVAERPGRPVRGYTMSRFDVLSQAIRPLYDEWLAAQGSFAKVEAFHRNVTGEPYEAGGTRLTQDVLARAATGAPMDMDGGDRYAGLPVSAGIDVGTLLHVVVSVKERAGTGTTRRLLRATTLRTFEDVAALLARYRVAVAVVDAGPETRKAQELRDACRRGGKTTVWLCRFHPTERVGRDDYGLTLDHAARVVTVDRTQVFDATFEELHGAPPRRVLARDALGVPDFAAQMCTPARVLTPDGSRYIWTKTPVADHYRLADIYDRIASDLHSRGARMLVVDGGRNRREPEDGIEVVTEEY